MTTTTEAVVAAIRTAGLPVAKLSKRDRVTGYTVRKINARAVSVEFSDWMHTEADYGTAMTTVLATLSAAGFRCMNPEIVAAGGIAAVTR